MLYSPEQSGFRPTATWENLRRRAAMLRRVREFFGYRGFCEVETPLLSADTVIDRHLDPFAVCVGSPGPSRTYWLQTSPEFAMKRLLAAGATAIYQITRAFRRDEQGPLHNPEFTMVEWYRVGDGLAEGMQLLSDFAEDLLQRGPAEKVSYREAFQTHAGIDPFQTPNEELPAVAARLGVVAPESLSVGDRDGWLDLLMAERVQPQLGRTRPAILYDYPASQAALARVRDEAPAVAERFELIVDGVELANGYHELLDSAVLRRRNAEINALRVADGKTELPEDSRLLAAMESGLPPCAGTALGFDRLVMLAAGASSLEEVIAFPFDRA